MRSPEENDIYNLFRARLTNPDKNTFEDDSWDAMEQLLDKKQAKKRPVIWLYRVSTGIAAALLLFAAFYLLRPVTPVKNKVAKLSNDLLKPVAGKGTPAAKRQPEAPLIHQTKGSYVAFLTKQSRKESGSDLVQHQFKAVIPADSLSPAGLNLAGVNTKKIFADTLSILAETLPATDTNPVAGNKKLTKTAQAFRRQFTLSVLAAPDVNNANKISNGGQLGSNFGMQFSMQLSKRISISSGAFYAVRPYETASSNYKPQTQGWWASRFGSTGKPDQVVANCKVLDIPLNVNYQLYSKGKNKLTLGTGLSSYFMLSEAYHFNFADPSVNTPDFKINNRNQHVFGLINANATYERKIDDHFGILIQPYMKLPITQIGFGQVNLRSSGVSLGLSWNINSAKAK